LPKKTPLLATFSHLSDPPGAKNDEKIKVAQNDLKNTSMMFLDKVNF
jgi:hypothetical protein